MSEIKNIQGYLAGLRAEQQRLDLDLANTRARLETLTLKINRITGGAGDHEGMLKQFRAERTTLLEQKRSLLARAGEIRNSFSEIGNRSLRNIDPRAAVEQLDDSHPLLLFPLRLETRFKHTGNQPQLWLRVYPDDCNVIKKEPLLTEDELTNARNFWIEMAKAGKVKAEEKGAWNMLVHSHGANRASWIIRQYQPLNKIQVKKDSSYKILVAVNEDGANKTMEKELATYWRSYWLADGDPQKEKEAFAGLKLHLRLLDDKRVQDLLDSSRPQNISDKLPEGITAGKVLVTWLNLPPAGTYTTTLSSWNQAAQAVALPDKFVTITYAGDTKKSFQFENPVGEYLPVGLDPSLEDGQITKDDNKEINLNEDLQWMVDFDRAVAAGMATRINLTQEEALTGFDQVSVLGIRLSADAQKGKEELENLISLHRDSKQGFAFIRQGTPTNNTENSASGYSRVDDPDESYERVFRGSENFTLSPEYVRQSDAQRFADILGIDPAVLQGLPNANGSDQREAFAMNMALFPATLGYCMEEMMDPLFSDRDLLDTKQFLARYVSGRGPVPAVKIGEQPYGILPVTVFSRLRFSNEGTNPAFPTRLYALISEIDKTWDQLLPGVSYVGKEGDPHQVLLDVLGLHAHSVEFHQRYAQTIRQVYNQLILQTGSPLIAFFVALAILKRGELVLRDLGLPTSLELPILEKYFLSEPNRLSGPLIDDVPESETDPVRDYSADNKNYIAWLRTSDGETIRRQDFGGNPAPNALLYLLLRHAVQLSQSGAATGLLLGGKLAKHKREFFDPDFLHIGQTGGRSKFEHLYQASPGITGDPQIPLIKYIYIPEVLSGRPEVRPLKETLDALEVLEKTPTARLERLLTEHLDCCSYRIDAWKTGLTQYNLARQRKSAADSGLEKGLYLGAYGWLLNLRPKNAAPDEITLNEAENRIFNPTGKKIYTDSSNLGYIHAPSIDQAATAAILRNAYNSNSGSGTKNPFAVNLSSERIRIANNFLEGIRNGQPLSALLGYQFERGLHDRYASSGIEADRFIYPLRMAFPLVAGNLRSSEITGTDMEEAVQSNHLTNASKTIEVVEAHNVIDGLKLIHHVSGSVHKTYPFGLPPAYGLPEAGPEEIAVIGEEIDRIIDMHDAIADLVMSEQVYQAVKGNFDRAAGVAEAFSKGSYPPEMEVINTPRTGLTLTHKLAIHFNAGADTATSPDPSIAMTPRAALEPAVNEWLSGILPDPVRVQCKVIIREPGREENEIVITQRDLGLQPIDVLFSAALDTDQAMNELDDRIVHYVLHHYTDPVSGRRPGPFTKLNIQYTEDIDPADRSVVPFFELAPLVQSLRKILIGNKHVTHETFHLSSGGEEVQNAVYDHAGMNNRISALRDGLDQLGNGLQTRLNSIGSPDDFTGFDTLIQDTHSLFMEAALYDNNQTGTGFITQALGEIHDGFLGKLDNVIDRWTDKMTAYRELMDTYDTGQPEEDLFNLLRKVERTISTESTLSNDLETYRTEVETKASEFENVWNELIAIRTNPADSVIGFLSETEPVLEKIGLYDVISFDTENNRNDLYSARKSLLSLKEDIHEALDNLHTSLVNKIKSFEEEEEGLAELISDADIIDKQRNAAKKILGDALVLLPRFGLADSSAEEFALLYSNSESILKFLKENENRMLPVDDWFTGVARVRKSAWEYENVMSLSGGFNPDAEIRLTPLQFPYKENDRWLAMKFVKDKNEDTYHEEEEKPFENLKGDSLLYTAHFATEFDRKKPVCGIVLDEWTEVVPSKEETTGITFHYDQPNSEPPQTMLLVTPPVVNGKWEWNDIVEAMEEALMMAKKRAVEPSMIDTTKYAQFLPASMMAVTPYWITMAINLALNNISPQNEE